MSHFHTVLLILRNSNKLYLSSSEGTYFQATTLHISLHIKQCNISSVEVSVLLHVHSWIFFKDNISEWVTFACDGTGPADESKRTKRIQGWSRLNWLGGILIIVSWHIHFSKLLMPLTPICCFAN